MMIASGVGSLCKFLYIDCIEAYVAFVPMLYEFKPAQ